MQSEVAIVGYGAVGRSLTAVFPDAVTYDEPLEIGTREAVNACRFALVCVPTPPAADGSCDTSIVEEVVAWLETDVIVILSTVAPGTTERLVRETGKRIVFQPAYGPGETFGHPFSDLHKQDWLILGGEEGHTEAVADLYRRALRPETVIRQTSARTAELTKYMENAYLALKVTFCNEFYDIADSMDVDYAELRDLWLLDPRIGASHSLVFTEDRGYGGKCLPKDVSAIVQAASVLGYKPSLLTAMRDTNAAFRSRNADSQRS